MRVHGNTGGPAFQVVDRRTDPKSNAVYGFFVHAWGPTYDAARRELP
ncbi:hypothetical protein SNE35_31215 [Paucibacter sp. R3-3]|uniref:Uncharacterized protein n=1 Tax=Roseateles agri TaxID=3098619 RepID=A0ABU5DT70_9BURK|nr:hypothetical protein [Paucibacter sp. R3-3]MDY0749010.1 hypothetical protein [Paucibacter sp. R3-3]